MATTKSIAPWLWEDVKNLLDHLVVATFADLPATPLDGQTCLVQSLNWTVTWNDSLSVWQNAMGQEVDASYEV